MPTLRLVCLGLGSVALLLHLIGMATPFWNYVKFTVESHEVTGSVGLWESCQNSACVSNTAAHAPLLDAARAMSVLALIAGVGAMALYGVYVWSGNVLLSKVSLATLCFSALCILVAILSWTFFLDPRARKYISWSFGLCATAMCLFVVDVVLMGRQLSVDSGRDGYLPA